ncbi:hypothetical protein ACU5EH_00795 [Aliivibrio salmonicida]|uniref:hypothetical protein n=1 Tax=Aliivibrio salmonicida TaxID=40269 RepID=UPI00406D4DC4
MKKLLVLLITLVAPFIIYLNSDILVQIDKEVFKFFENINNFIYPIFLSIIAALIFWIINEFIPQKQRKKKIDPVLNLLFQKLESDIRCFIYSSLSPNDCKVPAIDTKNLKALDFQFALKNKLPLSSSLPDDHVIYKHIDKSRIIISGKEILEDINRINSRINNILLIQEFCTTEELVFVHNLRDIVNTYEPYLYMLINPTNSNERNFVPVDPSLSSLSSSFYSCYNLVNKNNDLFDKRKSEPYFKLLKYIENGQNHLFSFKYERLSHELQERLLSNAIEVEWNIGDKTIFTSYLIKLITSENFNVISYRNFIAKYYKYKIAREIFDELLPNNYQEQFFQSIKRDHDLKTAYYLTNSFLHYSYHKEFYNLDNLNENTAYLSYLDQNLRKFVKKTDTL